MPRTVVQQLGCAASRVRHCDAGRLRLLVACFAALATPWLGAGAASLGVPADFGLPVTKGGALYLNFSRDGQQRLLEVCVCVFVCVCVCLCVFVCVWRVCVLCRGRVRRVPWLAAMTSGALQMLCTKGMRGARTCRIARELVALGGCCARARRAVLTPRGQCRQRCGANHALFCSCILARGGCNAVLRLAYEHR
jgi:hypothetical protein